MAGKIQLDITTTAHIEGIEKARAGLKSLGKETMSFNQISKSGDMSALSLKMMENFRTTSLAKNETKAYTSYLGQLNRAYKEMVPLVQQGKAFTVDSDGSQRQIESLKELHKIFADLTGEVKTYAETYAQGVAKKKGLLGDEGFGSEKFLENTKRSGDAVKAFGTDLESVQYKMNMIKEQGTKMLMTGGYKEDSKEIVKLQDEYAKLTKEHEALSRAANGTGQRIKHLIWNFVSAQLIVFALRKAFSLLVGGIKESSQAAAEAEQVMQKFSTVFEGLDAAQQSVDRLTQSFGLASTSAKNIMATIGDMAYGLGASQQEAAEFAGMTAEFIQDLIAFKDIGGDVIEVTQSFMSGAAGNTRNFRKWGSIVKENTIAANLHKKGLDQLTGSELEWAKAQERVAVVMEQQKNAFGATEREWDMMLSVQRRFKEETKQLKESIGESVNTFFLPMKTALLEMITLYNKGAEAKKNFAKNPTNPQSEYLWDEDMARAMKVSASKEYSNYDMKSVSEFESFISYFGAPWEEALPLIRTLAGISKDLEADIRKYFTVKDESKRVSSGLSAEKQAEREYYKNRGEVMADMSAMFLNMGAEAYLGRGSSEFSSPTVSSVLGADTSTTDNNAKLEKLLEIYNELNNIITTEKDPFLLEEAEAKLSLVIGGMKSLNDEIQAATFTDQITEIAKQMRSLEVQNGYIKNYGAEMGGIYYEWYEALQKTYDTKEKAMKAGMTEKEAEAQRLLVEEQINKQYGVRVGYSKDAADEAERIAAAERATTEHLRVQEALLKAREDIAGVYSSNQRSKATLATPFGQSTQQEALTTMNYAKQDAQVSANNMAESFLTDMQKQAVRASDMLTTEMMLSAEQIAEVTAYRTQLEEEAELEYQQVLKDARDSSLESIQAVWDSLGDVGMIRGWIDNFKNILEFEQSQGNEDATKTAVMGTLWGILGEFLGRLESVNELLSMVSSFMDMIGPVVDQFLAPLLVVLGPLLEMLADMILPVLEMLFPVIQVIAVVLISAIAVIKTFNAAVNWVTESIKVALWNMTHWFDKRNYPNLGAEIGEIWEDADEKVAKIWALEIDTRVQYVSDLTDAQKGEIDAYKQMYKDGLLSASETSALINKNVYGKTTDLVKTTDLSGSAGARSITYGDITINVPAGTDIDAEALAKLIVAEQGKQERRGA